MTKALLPSSKALSQNYVTTIVCLRGRKKAHKHKLFALVNVQMALGQTAGCPRVNRAKKFMCSPRNTGNINFSLWLTGGLSQGCPDFQKVYVFKVYVPFSCRLSAYEGNQQRTGYYCSMRVLQTPKGFWHKHNQFRQKPPC